jgi:pimeloyl-ACP methyl ester carboxylesterase
LRIERQDEFRNPKSEIKLGMGTDTQTPYPRRIARLLWRAARPFLIAYVCVVLIAMSMERRLIYPAPPFARGDWNATDPAHEDVWFTSADGTRLHGWFLPHPMARRTILYCHGNGEHVALDGDLCGLLRDRLKASVFVFDYPGYGHSDGKPGEASCIAAAQAARDWLVRRLGIQSNEIILLGHSLGGGVATALAADGGARALVLENTFSNMADVAAHSHWWLPIRLVMRNRYDSVARIRKYDGPLIQTHGAADSLVPIHFGRALFDASPSKLKRFIEGVGGHDDGPPDNYYQVLAAFLDEVDAALQPASPSPPDGGPPTSD